MNLIVCNEDTHFATKEFLEKKLLAVKAGMSENALSAVTHVGGFSMLWGGAKKAKIQKEALPDAEV